MPMNDKQCNQFQRGGQRVSRLCMVLVAGAALFSGITLIIALCHVITWLTYLMYFSYIKLGVTLIKYIPQVDIVQLLVNKNLWTYLLLGKKRKKIKIYKYR